VPATGDGTGRIEGDAPGGDNGTGNGATVDLANIGGDEVGGGDSPGERPRRKYSPRKSRTERASEDLALTALLTENIFVFHSFLHGLTGQDWLKIEEAEANTLGGAINNVARHYDIPQVTQKAADWIRLARAIGMVYGGRIMYAASLRKPKPVAVPKAEPVKTADPANGSKLPEAFPATQKVHAYPGGPLVEVPFSQ
jgi:hypothetical protein